ncbi:hypothetical protein [Achromobacter pestifer]
MYDIEKRLVKDLSPILRGKGFVWTGSQEQYIRKQPWGFDYIGWSCFDFDSRGSLELSLIIGVRHDAVEDLVNKLELVYGEKNKKYTTTVSRVLRFFPFDSGRGVWQIYRESANEEIAKFVSHVSDVVDGAGGDFYKKYSNVLECSRGLNLPIEVISHPLCNNLHYRIYNGLACAMLSEPSRVLELTRQYLDYANITMPVDVEKIKIKIDKLISFGVDFIKS